MHGVRRLPCAEQCAFGSIDGDGGDDDGHNAEKDEIHQCDDGREAAQEAASALPSTGWELGNRGGFWPRNRRRGWS